MGIHFCVLVQCLGDFLIDQCCQTVSSVLPLSLLTKLTPSLFFTLLISPLFPHKRYTKPLPSLVSLDYSMLPPQSEVRSSSVLYNCSELARNIQGKKMSLCKAIESHSGRGKINFEY